ncbi:MAG: hypothetical protein GF393_08715 [Armatimonadia bacterium]|nr:hypothetical protein [Armatimonadia bacterium]
MRYDLIPPEALRALAEVLTYGARKYGDRNWEQGLDWSRPYAAGQRHLWAWWAREGTDPETGLSHLAHAICNLAMLIHHEQKLDELDDRPQ